MFVPITKTTSKFKAIVSIAVISVHLIIYVILSFMTVDSKRILVKLPVLQADTNTIEIEPEVELPLITRKSAFSVLKTYLFRLETQCLRFSFINRLIFSLRSRRLWSIEIQMHNWKAIVAVRSSLYYQSSNEKKLFGTHYIFYFFFIWSWLHKNRGILVQVCLERVFRRYDVIATYLVYSCVSNVNKSYFHIVASSCFCSDAWRKQIHPFYGFVWYKCFTTSVWSKLLCFARWAWRKYPQLYALNRRL